MVQRGDGSRLLLEPRAVLPFQTLDGHGAFQSGIDEPSRPRPIVARCQRESAWRRLERRGNLQGGFCRRGFEEGGAEREGAEAPRVPRHRRRWDATATRADGCARETWTAWADEAVGCERAHRLRYDSTSPLLQRFGMDGRAETTRVGPTSQPDVVRVVSATQDSTIGLARDQRQARVVRTKGAQRWTTSWCTLGWTGRMSGIRCICRSADGRDRADRARAEAGRAARVDRAAAAALAGGKMAMALEQRKGAVIHALLTTTVSCSIRSIPSRWRGIARPSAPAARKTTARFRALVGPGRAPPRQAARVGARHGRESHAGGAVRTAPETGESARGTDKRLTSLLKQSSRRRSTGWATSRRCRPAIF